MADTGRVVIPAHRFDGVIVDLDGVVTKTARVHAVAWKRLFDDFLRRHDGAAFTPFSIDVDYVAYVDGRPRYEGVEAFLASRGITLPHGSHSDPPGDETICALGNTKNDYFREAVASNGVETYDHAVAFVKHARAAGFGVAVVTASKNCRLILEAAGLESLFDVQIDGNDVEKTGLKGKPEPNTFLEAARHLDTKPRRCVVIEDALVGVEAGRKGAFGLVIGVDRHGDPTAFLDHGADAVVDDLGKLSVEALPSAIDRLDEIASVLRDRPHAVCLDYDGTLTPIVSRPDLATLPETTRDVIRKLQAICPVAVVSGRELADVRRLVGLDMTYAADHGFELAIPGAAVETYEPANALRDEIAEVAHEVEAGIGSVPGVLVEPKQFSVAVHYRLVNDDNLPNVERAVSRLLREHPRLRLVEGKKVHEFRPDLHWDKGEAVRFLAQRLGVALDGIVYVGDDVTDEDAFRTIRNCGAGVVVWDRPRRTSAAYCLYGTDEVVQFLNGLAKALVTNGCE